MIYISKELWVPCVYNKKDLTQFLCSSSQDFLICFVQNHLLSIINCILKDSITFFVQFSSNKSSDLTFLSTKVKPFFTAWVECNSTFHNVLWDRDDITIRTVLSIYFGIWDLGKLFHYILSTYKRSYIVWNYNWFSVKCDIPK